MSILDLDALKAAEVHTDPCLFVVVPRFVRAEALESVNRDYPDIKEPGNFEPEGLQYGPAFEELVQELNSPELKACVSEKLDLDLTSNPLQMTARKFSEASDGNVHNDSKNKLVTALIYFNQDWPHDDGRLRICRSSWNLDDYAAEVTPEAGTLLIFRRNEASFHGFKPFEGERRSLQMYWVKPKRAPDSEKSLTFKKLIKRVLKHRPR